LKTRAADDLAVTLVLEDAGRGAVVVEVPLEVGVQDGVPLLLRHLPDDTVPGDPGIAHQDVQAAELVHDLVDHRLRLLEVGHVRLDGQRPAAHLLDLTLDLVGGVHPSAVGQRHVTAESAELQRHGGADPAAPPGDEGDLSLQIQVHARYPPRLF
jgi:hypothetical protein